MLPRLTSRLSNPSFAALQRLSSQESMQGLALTRAGADAAAMPGVPWIPPPPPGPPPSAMTGWMTFVKGFCFRERVTTGPTNLFVYRRAETAAARSAKRARHGAAPPRYFEPMPQQNHSASTAPHQMRRCDAILKLMCLNMILCGVASACVNSWRQGGSMGPGDGIPWDPFSRLIRKTHHMM